MVGCRVDIGGRRRRWCGTELQVREERKERACGEEGMMAAGARREGDDTQAHNEKERRRMVVALRCWETKTRNMM